MVGGESPLILPIFFPALLLRTALTVSERHGSRGVGLLEDKSSFLCPGGWVLRMISSDRDDRRIFWGLKFSISGFFWVGKFYQAFFSLGLLDLSRDFLGIQNNPKIRDSYIICCFLETFMAWKFVIGFFGGFFEVLFEALRIFLGFDFCPHSIIPVT